MQLKGVCAVLLIIAGVALITGCIFSHPRQWYNESFDPAPNTTIKIVAGTLGPNPIFIKDSDSDKINISIAYCDQPTFEQHLGDGSIDISASAIYRNDMTQGVGADIYVYLPRNVHYTVIIKNLAADGGIYVNESRTQVSYTRGNLTVLTEKY